VDKMITRHKRFAPVPAGRRGEPERDRQRLLDAYGNFLAAQIEPDRRYSLIRVPGAEFAYTNYTQYARALGDAWAAGLVPETPPAVAGRALPGAAPRLLGVDSDLADFSR
jgi:hypothetical protein